MTSRLLATTLTLGLLAACSSPPREVGAAEARCRAAGAQAELGKTVDAAVTETARASAGALRARVLRAGDAITQEVDPQRLNIEVDGEGRIRRLRCG